MTETGNISTLITIIFGLMLTDLFASIHRLLRRRRRIRWHWLPVLTAWYVLATVLKNWWGLVSSNGTGFGASGWMFFYYAHVLLLLYLITSAVLPDEVPDAGLDLRKYYFETRRHFWGLYALLSLVLLLFTVLQPLTTGDSVNWFAVLANVAMGVITLSLAWTGRVGYHAVVVVLMVALTTVEIIGKIS